MSKDDPLFVERDDGGRYKVERADADRASAVFNTQHEAIDWAKDHTRGPVHVERVRNTKAGGRDQWRRP
jgi:hypothetical protein